MVELRRDPDTAAALARLYDVDMLEDPGDLDLYLALATRTGGPILELAAGTGRIAIPLAKAGYSVVAVDIDPAMLARLSDRLADAPEQTRGRVEAVEADLLGLHLPGGERFKLSILGLNSMLLLDSRAKQRAAVETMARHLLPGGLAVVDVWLPGPDELSRYDGRLGLEYVRSDPDSGETVAKTTSATYEPAMGTVQLTALYEEAAQGGPVRRWIRQDELRLAGAEDLRGMAEEAGLEVEVVAGTYELDPIGPYDERAILVARRREGSRSATLV